MDFCLLCRPCGKLWLLEGSGYQADVLLEWMVRCRKQQASGISGREVVKQAAERGRTSEEQELSDGDIGWQA